MRLGKATVTCQENCYVMKASDPVHISFTLVTIRSYSAEVKGHKSAEGEENQALSLRMLKAASEISDP